MWKKTKKTKHDSQSLSVSPPPIANKKTLSTPTCSPLRPHPVLNFSSSPEISLTCYAAPRPAREHTETSTPFSSYISICLRRQQVGLQHNNLFASQTDPLTQLYFMTFLSNVFFCKVYGRFLAIDGARS